MKYFKFDHDLSAFDVTDKYDYVRLPYEDVGGKKVLFILDMVPSEDLKSGRLLSGCTGDLLQSLRNQAQKTFGRSKYSWCAITFNAFRTFGKSQEFQEQAREFFADRIRAMILRYKPDYVVSFGAHVMNALISKKLVQDSKGRTRYSYWLGVPIETSAVSEGKKHRFTYVPNLSLNDVVTGSSTEASMLGYMVKCLSPIYGKVYAVDEERLNNHKSVVISTYDEYKSLMRKVRRAPVVAIDTEADNLNKIVNRLLTVQFAVDDGTGYLLPMHHKDTPFTPRELTKIAADLRNYFEGDNENDYHIYANAKFDLTLFRTALGVRYFANDVWDIFGGEFCFHPDTLVCTEIGFMPISELVDVQVKPRVLSFNHENRTLEWSEILLCSEHETDEEMYELDYEGGTIQVTANHKIWSVTRDQYVRVDEIFVDEEVLVLP